MSFFLRVGCCRPVLLAPCFVGMYAQVGVVVPSVARHLGAEEVRAGKFLIGRLQLDFRQHQSLVVLEELVHFDAVAAGGD